MFRSSSDLRHLHNGIAKPIGATTTTTTTADDNKVINIDQDLEKVLNTCNFKVSYIKPHEMTVMETFKILGCLETEMTQRVNAEL